MVPAFPTTMSEETLSAGPFRARGPAPSDIALLAVKFFDDGNCHDGYERRNWLCAEYMLTQRQLIQYQVNALHDRELCPA